MASINQLKAQIGKSKGLSKPNQFLVELPFDNDGAGNILCTRATLPFKQILTHERRISMEVEKIAYGYAVDDISFSFLSTNTYGVKKYFDAWRSLIVNEDTLEVGYKKDYALPIKIHQLKRTERKLSKNIGLGPISFDVGLELGRDKIYSVELIEAFPTTYQAIELSNELDGVTEFTVQISYTNWKTFDATQSPLDNLSISNLQVGGVGVQQAISKVNRVNSLVKKANGILDKVNF
jgi:hypothetical protein